MKLRNFRALAPWWLVAGMVVACTFVTAPAFAQTPRKPNIVFLLSDNVGYGTLSSFNGGAIDPPTPRIDELAAEGLRLTNFNVENQCTPTRADGSN
jgi:hypothetical protein